MKILRPYYILIALTSFFACEEKQNADLVIKGGKVATVDESFSIKQAVAIKGNKIIYVGNEEAVEKYIGQQTKVIDASGKFVMPGMHDAHCHPYNLGHVEGEEEEDNYFSVGGSKDLDDLVAKVKEKIKTMKPGDWLIGGGWDQNEWPDKQFPVHDKLSAVSPDNPVFLYRHGGNSAFVNAKALEIAGITAETPDPFGGRIYRKPNGDPTGFVSNMGNNMVHKHFPKPNKPLEWYHKKYLNAFKTCNEAGLTAVTDAGIDSEHIEIYKSMVDSGTTTIRANVMLLNPREGDLEKQFRDVRVLNYGGEEMMQVRSIKMYYDGTVGSRGAAFFEPYLDDPERDDNIGVTEVPVDHVYKVARTALKTGMQVCPHALGIRANSEILDAFEKALKENPIEDHRFRSEHAEVVTAEDIKRFAEIGVIPSVQPVHCTSDMTFLEDRIGKQRCKESASPWRGMIDAGLKIACGSDFAVESHKPLWGIYAAITRQDHLGLPEDGWYAEHCMTREEAIKGYTIWAAHAAFWDDILGSLETGKLADIVILDKDILTIAPKEILTTKVLYTIVNGKIVYQMDRQ
ncbi:amidohydrolase [Fulvivirgaceae bacterium BMA10]|uniref:Amidohydrolase n=1 Tax=Splendidivirga corallicola TaxID=3051826 RepID=A0ABT8KVB9_9BACT|nr:amidohydrolase [Fulvivirgaceae bacterium BMA10]